MYALCSIGGNSILRFLIYPRKPTQDDFIDFAEKLSEDVGKKVILISDLFPMCHNIVETRGYIQFKSSLEIFFDKQNKMCYNKIKN